MNYTLELTDVADDKIRKQIAGKLAPWLAPEQVRVLPVSGAQHEYAQALVAELDAAQIRVNIDTSSESLANRVFQAHASGVSFAVIIGNRETGAGSATLRERSGQNQALPRGQAIALLRERCKPVQ